MKKIILIFASILIYSCEENKLESPKKVEEIPIQQPSTPPIKSKFVTYYKHIKDLKEVQETQTDYHYKYNIWKGNFDQVPDVNTVTKYFIIYDDHTHDEVSRDEWLNYSKGDSIQSEKEVFE